MGISRSFFFLIIYNNNYEKIFFITLSYYGIYGKEGVSMTAGVGTQFVPGNE
jgi:hypothetical protein